MGNYVGNSQLTQSCVLSETFPQRELLPYAVKVQLKDEEAKVLECLQRSSPIYSVAKVLKNISSHSVHLGKLLRSTAQCSLKGQFLARKPPKNSRRKRKDLVSLKFVLL